jgi:hypothetical protein
VGMCKRVVKGIVVGMRGGSLFENEAFPTQPASKRGQP